jgi:hypothetical protein
MTVIMHINAAAHAIQRAAVTREDEEEKNATQPATRRSKAGR